MIFDMAFLLEPVKNSRTLPGTCFDDALSAFGQDAGNIFKQSAACDMAMPLMVTLFMASRTGLT